jgi:hypothetical protein
MSKSGVKIVKENIIVSPKGEMIPQDWARWRKNTLEFLKPFLIVVGTMYVSNLVGVLQQPEHVVSLSDFIPTPNQVTTALLFVVNSLWDILRKLQTEKTYIEKA